MISGSNPESLIHGACSFAFFFLLSLKIGSNPKNLNTKSAFLHFAFIFISKHYAQIPVNHPITNPSQHSLSTLHLAYHHVILSPSSSFQEPKKEVTKLSTGDGQLTSHNNTNQLKFLDLSRRSLFLYFFISSPF
jgi:hypothetical protein